MPHQKPDERNTAYPDTSKIAATTSCSVLFIMEETVGL
jgi:hypothetical protein